MQHHEVQPHKVAVTPSKGFYGVILGLLKFTSILPVDHWKSVDTN